MVQGSIALGPVAEKLFNVFFEHGAFHLTHYEENGVIWHEDCAMKVNQSLARSGIDRFRRRSNSGIWMIAKHHPGNQLGGEKRRLRALLLQALFGILFG